MPALKDRPSAPSLVGVWLNNRDWLSYDAASGNFIRVVKRAKYLPGSIVGTKGRHGYIVISLGGYKFLAHRLAWAAYYNEAPGIIDHINGSRTDNRIDNLRVATPTQNSANRRCLRKNSTGYKGVIFWNGRWRAKIQLSGKSHHIGMYDTAAEAHAAYASKAVEFFGQFAQLK